MKLRHATLARNLASIRRRGHLTSQEQGPSAGRMVAHGKPLGLGRAAHHAAARLHRGNGYRVRGSALWADAEQCRLVVYEPRHATGPRSTNRRDR